MCGVTLATYTDYCRRKGLPTPNAETLKRLPYAQWREIIKGMFWDRWHADGIRSQSVAEALVDWLWHSGAPGITRPQKLLGVKADGIVGPKTIAAVNAADPRKLFEAICADRRTFFYGIVARKPSQGVFLQGWLNRVNGLKFTN